MKIILIILILILALYFYNLFNTIIFEHNIENIKESNGYYMNKEELYEYLIKDNDNYFKNFSNIDMKVRNVNNIEEYYQKIKQSCSNIDKPTQTFLNKCITIANNRLNNYKCIGFDGAKCANIIWNIGIIKDRLYEEGYPHTRYNVIIIPSRSLNNKDSLINTLIHEKIHVYQKMYPNDIEQYLEANGFTKYKLRSTFNNTRSNPDMDEWIYKNKNNEIMMAEYNNDPKSIMDVHIKPNNTSKYEHPFEYMAYHITSDIHKN
jgi:hypothetical protein